MRGQLFAESPCKFLVGRTGLAANLLANERSLKFELILFELMLLEIRLLKRFFC